LQFSQRKLKNSVSGLERRWMDATGDARRVGDVFAYDSGEVDAADDAGDDAVGVISSADYADVTQIKHLCKSASSADRRFTPLTSDPADLQKRVTPHARGAILVAAVFDAFIAIYKERVADLLRINTGGRGVLPNGAIHPDLVRRLAGEASRAASHVLNMRIRALDYLPPVDVKRCRSSPRNWGSTRGRRCSKSTSCGSGTPAFTFRGGSTLVMTSPFRA
jgi:hypothetical protein